MTHTHSQGTDEAFYDLMQLSGAAILKLLGFAPEIADSYQFRAIELKQKQLQRPDIEAMPALESMDTRALIEFQGYEDPLIRFRALRNLVQAVDNLPDAKPIISIIIYTSEVYRQVAKPLQQFMPDIIGNPIREHLLTDYSAAELMQIDPRLILLMPFTVPTDLDKTELKHNNLQWTNQIRSIYTEPQQQQKALQTFGFFLLNRFRDLNIEEVLDMLNIDLMDSRAGQQIFERGKLEGKREGKLEGIFLGMLEGEQRAKEQQIEAARTQIINVLQKRFETVPNSIAEKLARYKSLTDLMEVYGIAVSCETLEAFIAHCRTD